MTRVIAYVDGFNLYFGLKEAGFRRFYWLNIQALITKLLRPDQQLVYTHYFTSRVSSNSADPHKAKRQSIYLDALGTLSSFGITYGHYLTSERICRRCGARWLVQSEKMTDVNIATELLTNAFQDSFDTALVVSADSDLVGPIDSVLRLFSTKRVIVALPPARSSKRLIQTATGFTRIGRSILAQSQLPNPVILPGGMAIYRPVDWA